MNNAAVNVRFWTARCINTSKGLCILSWAFSDTKHYLFSLHVLFSLNLSHLAKALRPQSLVLEEDLQYMSKINDISTEAHL